MLGGLQVPLSLNSLYSIKGPQLRTWGHVTVSGIQKSESREIRQFGGICYVLRLVCDPKLP